MVRGKWGGKKLYNFYKLAGSHKEAQQYADKLKKMGKRYRIFRHGVNAYGVYEYLGK